MRLLARYLAIAFVLTIGVPTDGRADELYGFVQRTCAPEIGYFSIRRIQLINLQHGHPYGFPDTRTPAALSRLSMLGVRYGIYDAISLQTAPIECDLPINLSRREQPAQGSSVKVRTVGVYDDNNGHAAGERQIQEYVEIFVGKTLVGRLFLNPYGISSDGTDLIEVTGNGVTLEATVCSRQTTIDKEKSGCVKRDLGAAPH